MAGEMALEVFLKQVREHWVVCELEMATYRSRVRLIKGWDVSNGGRAHIPVSRAHLPISYEPDHQSRAMGLTSSCSSSWSVCRAGAVLEAGGAPELAGHHEALALLPIRAGVPGT